MDTSLQHIGVIRSPYREKFAVPRQPGLVNSAVATLELLPPFNRPEAVRGLDEFSHIWLLFIFNQTRSQGWRPTVRPPRLGGNERVGVFASRSPFRPNPLGMSAVELVSVESGPRGTVLRLRGIDLVDGTPVVDIKPYLPYTDVIADAKGGYAPSAPSATGKVTFSQTAQLQLEQVRQQYPELKQLISDLLAQNPQPAYQQKDLSTREYGVQLYDFNVRWSIKDDQTLVISLDSIKKTAG